MTDLDMRFARDERDLEARIEKCFDILSRAATVTPRTKFRTNLHAQWFANIRNSYCALVTELKNLRKAHDMHDAILLK